MDLGLVTLAVDLSYIGAGWILSQVLEVGDWQAGTAAVGVVAVTWMYESRPFILRRDIITNFQSFQLSDLSFSMCRNKVWRCVDRVLKSDDIVST